MNKFSWFAHGSAVTAVGAGIVALVMDDSDESWCSSESADSIEHTEGTDTKVIYDDESIESTTFMTDDKNMNDPASTDNADSKPNDGADLNPTSETYPQVNKDKFIFSNTNTGQSNADMPKE